jgi:hypothetical protein
MSMCVCVDVPSSTVLAKVAVSVRSRCSSCSAYTFAKIWIIEVDVLSELSRSRVGRSLKIRRLSVDGTSRHRMSMTAWCFARAVNTRGSK